MPKLKFAMLDIMPLCLKLRGRLVGAVSRSRIGIYSASGLLLLSSLLLLIILMSINYAPETVGQPKKQIQQEIKQEASIPVQKQNEIIAVLPQPVQEKETLVIPKSIQGQIQVDFGWQPHQVYNDWRYHTGIDISGSIGQGVEAIDKGQVIDIIRDPQSGLTVLIKSNKSTIYYGSLSEAKVSKDSLITAGQTIGVMGSCDAEPYQHLHLAIKKDEEYIDPKVMINVNSKESINN